MLEVQRFIRQRFLLIATILVLALSPQQSARAAKNVILMVADGGGHNQWLAASMYQGKVGKQIYDQPDWLRLSCSTYSLNLLPKPTGNTNQIALLVYDPAKAWDATPNSDKPRDFAGYFHLQMTPTDSAAAATALASGQKTYNNAINWTNDGKPMAGQTIAEIAKQQGKAVGVITSVQWSHATPAGLGGAHNISRNHYVEIANEMLGSAWLDVIMGAGNPNFDDNGQPLAEGKKREFRYVGGEETWQALKHGERGWKLIESKADFEALASGPTPPKVLGTAQAASTLQEGRSRPVVPNDKTVAAEPFAVPRNDNVPSLAVMAEAAINCLDDNPKGFYLMIEGGAVDWANHANRPDRMVEEQIDYVQAVETVVAWIESHGGWNDTLLILTADHESGLLWGPDSSKVAFQPLEDRGPGKLPGLKYNSSGHANSLVPIYARGPGSRRFTDLIRGKDATAAAVWSYSGQYIDNTDIFAVMRAEVTAEK